MPARSEFGAARPDFQTELAAVDMQAKFQWNRQSGILGSLTQLITQRRDGPFEIEDFYETRFPPHKLVITKFTAGGVILNVGSAVTGPEVLLKAVSMAANVGRAPSGIVTADFDIREYRPDEMSDESSAGYYCRDQKSVVARIPQAFEGKSFYVQGNQKQTFPLLFKMIIEEIRTGGARV